MIEWLQKWYLSRCDGDWEHEYGIVIQTIDNPGWIVTIDLSYTNIQDLEIPYKVSENSDDNWVGYSIEKKQFKGSGDPQKLNDIIKIFKEIWEAHEEK